MASVEELLDADPMPMLVLLAAAGERAALEATIRRLRGDERMASTALVVVGAADDEQGVVGALRAGADDFFPRGLRPAELRARLEARLRGYRAAAELRRRQRGAAMLLDLTQALSSSVHIRDILFLVVRRIAEVLEVDRVSVILGGQEDEIGYVIAASDDQKLRDLPIRLTDYPEIGKALETGEPLVIADAAEHPLFELARVAPPTRFRWLALCPIRFEDRVMGVLFLRDRHPHALDDTEMFLLRAMANATGIALRNARLLQSLRDQSRRSRFAHFEAEKRVKSLQRYLDIFDSSADGIVVIDAAGRVLFCNPAACGIVRRTAQNLRSSDFSRLLYKDGRRRFDKLRKSFAHGEYPHNVDLAIRTPAGERRILSVSFNSTLGEDSGIIVSFRDVTRDRALARELTQTKEFLERVIASSVDAIVSADMKGRVLLFNPAAERICGYKAAEVVGRMNVRDLYPDGTAVEIMKLIRSEDKGGAGALEAYHTELLGKNGSHIPVLLTAALIIHRNRPIGSVGVFRDLRARLEMEAELAETRQELAVQEKKAVVAELAGATAHELNQPLTAIMGYGEMLSRRLGEGGQLGGAIGAIVRESERMASMVRKIGKLTKYETKPYVGEAKILDIDRSVGSDRPPARTRARGGERGEDDDPLGAVEREETESR